PAHAVDLGEFARFPRPGRPFQREDVASDRGRIAIALDRPRVDRFPAFLPDGRERDEVAFDSEPRFLEQLATRGHEWILELADLALRDAPRARVLLRPERAAGMGEQHLELAAPHAIDQN